MKKRLLAMLMCVAMVATLLVGCGEDKPADDATTNSPTPTPTTAVQATPTTPVIDENYETIDPVAHLTFDGEDEGYVAITQIEDLGTLTGATYGIGETDVNFIYSDGAVGKCLYLDGKYGVDLNLEPTNTDAYSVSFWLYADRLSTYGPTLQMGHNMGMASDAGNNVTWFNVTQSEWGESSAKIFPIVWSRNEASDAAADVDCWPWMYGFDNAIHGKREWVMVTIVCTGEEQTGPTGNKTVGAEYYINGTLVYDSHENYSNGTWFEYTWDATLAPNIMKPGDAEFESYFGVNYWDTIFKGFVDDLYVFDQAIAAGQVRDLYQLGNPNVVPSAEGAGEELPTVGNAEITGTAVGAVDYTTAFWGAHSQTWEVASGESKTVTFKNYHGAEASNWNNFVVVLQNVADAHSATDNADYKEYFVGRADNYGWAGEVNTGVADHGLCTVESTWDWTTFEKDIQGATVELTVTNNGTSADIVAKVTAADGTTVREQKYLGIAVDGAVHFCLTVDSCCLDIIG